MKFLIASDIHGDLEGASKCIEIADSERCDRIILLGDLLYHGPRNDLPPAYAPKRVIELLNANKDRILAVRGNCDTEVDQMVLEFPILADYAYVCDGDIGMFLTHGHRYNLDTPPILRPKDVLIHGHTHLVTAEPTNGRNLCINPGSTSIPKGGFPRSYCIYENGKFSIYGFDGVLIKEAEV